SELRELPREEFKAHLKSDLERTLSMATARQPITAVRTFASPRLSYKSAAKAIEFYEKAFGAKESWRFETGSGIGHAEIMIGDSTIMLCEEWPEGGRYSAETLYLDAQDGPALLEFAKQAFGAEETFRTVGSAGGLHSSARIGDSMLMIGGGIPGREFRWTPNTHALHIYVKDVDAVYQK